MTDNPAGHACPDCGSPFLTELGYLRHREQRHGDDPTRWDGSRGRRGGAA